MKPNNQAISAPQNWHVQVQSLREQKQGEFEQILHKIRSQTALFLCKLYQNHAATHKISALFCGLPRRVAEPCNTKMQHETAYNATRPRRSTPTGRAFFISRRPGDPPPVSHIPGSHPPRAASASSPDTPLHTAVPSRIPSAPQRGASPL